MKLRSVLAFAAVTAVFGVGCAGDPAHGPYGGDRPMARRPSKKPAIPSGSVGSLREPPEVIVASAPKAKVYEGFRRKYKMKGYTVAGNGDVLRAIHPEGKGVIVFEFKALSESKTQVSRRILRKPSPGGSAAPLEDMGLAESPIEQGSPAPAESSASAPTETARKRSDVDDVPDASPEPKPNAHAVVIGVERYRGSLPRAEFASGDAQLVSDYLIKALGYPEENVAVLSEDQAAKSDFEKYFERWLPNRVEKGDEVFVYYSGHGAPDPKTGEAFLVPYDGDPTYLQETGYSLKRLYQALGKLPSEKVTVVLDSCFSGSGGRSVIAKGARPLVSVVSAGALPGNLTMVSASGSDQISNSFEEKGHGLFTYFFLKGVARQAGRRVSLKEAFDYAAPEVRKTARRQYNNDQEPQWREGP